MGRDPHSTYRKLEMDRANGRDSCNEGKQDLGFNVLGFRDQSSVQIYGRRYCGCLKANQIQSDHKIQQHNCRQPLPGAFTRDLGHTYKIVAASRTQVEYIAATYRDVAVQWPTR